MFFSSVLVPSTSLPAGRTLTLASARSEPSSMLQSLTPRRRRVVRSWRRNAPRLGGGAEVRLGDDLEQRRAAAVEVDPRALGARPAAVGADVHELGGVLLQVGARDPHRELARPAVSTETRPPTQIGSSYWEIWYAFERSG